MHPTSLHKRVARAFEQFEWFSLALCSNSPQELCQAFKERDITHTPDGIPLTTELLEYGWKWANETIKED